MKENETYESAVYTVKDLMELLKVGRNTAYKIVQDADFPVLHAGKNIRIPKKGFDEWLTRQTGEGHSLS